RVQLAHAGAAIAGDRLYAGAPASRLMLHAAKLTLRRPADERRLELAARLPLELEHFLEHGACDAVTDSALLSAVLSRALESRYRLSRARSAPTPTTAFRLLHRAADGTPELAVDVYDQYVVAHAFGDAFEASAAAVLDALDALGFAGVYLKRHAKQKNELSREADPERAPVE